MTNSNALGVALRVVVIDDTLDFRVLMRLALERAGDFQWVGEAGDGQAGVALVRQHHPDVVLLDISMPVMDGLQALPLVREICPDAAVVILSAFSASTMGEQAVARGADGYLQKGQPMRTLMTLLRAVVADTGQATGSS